VIPPILLLCLLLGVTAAASIADALARHARAHRLSQLAAAWDLRFTPEDRFQLTPRIASQFPTPGAADVVVRDILYGQEPGGRLRYLFTIEYTVGVLRTKRRRSAVGMVVESPHTAAAAAASPDPDLVLAPTTMPTNDQYEWLWKQHAEGTLEDR
jgi:hypothetical protein